MREEGVHTQVRIFIAKKNRRGDLKKVERTFVHLQAMQQGSPRCLKVNPFRDRICKVFSTDGYFTFEDVLGMASAFSDLACQDLKIEYAFRIYDFNEDGFIDEDDLRNVIRRLLNRNSLTEEEIVSLASHILEEADLDNDRLLSLTEFEHAMAKSPDFLQIDF